MKVKVNKRAARRARKTEEHLNAEKIKKGYRYYRLKMKELLKVS
jgi:hypothetical protein